MKAVTILLAIVFASQWIEALSQEAAVTLGLSSMSTVPTEKKAILRATEGGSVKVCFNPDSKPSGPSVLSVKTKSGTAKVSEDFTALDTRLTFTEKKEQCVWVYPFLDTAGGESDESFTIEATGQSGDYSSAISFKVTVTIRNRAVQQSSISIEHDNYPVMEDAGKVSVCASYFGSQPLASNVFVTLSTLDSTSNPLAGGSSVSPASDMTDYTTNSTILNFVAGSDSGTRRCIDITIKADTTAENEETFQVVASISSGSIKITPLTSATVRITETKTVAPSSSITAGRVNVNSNGNSTSPSGEQGSVTNGSGLPVTCTLSLILLLIMTCTLTLV